MHNATGPSTRQEVINVKIGHELRSKRIAAGIPGRLVCSRASISRSKLSEIEAGFRTVGPEELQRIREVLQNLITARMKVEAFAESVGWPL